MDFFREEKEAKAHGGLHSLDCIVKDRISEQIRLLSCQSTSATAWGCLFQSEMDRLAKAGATSTLDKLKGKIAEAVADPKQSLDALNARFRSCWSWLERELQQTPWEV